jgi:hypothetical protein
MLVDKGPLEDRVIRSRQLPLPPSAGAAQALARHLGELLRLIGRTNQQFSLRTALNRQTKPQAESPHRGARCHLARRGGCGPRAFKADARPLRPGTASLNGISLRNGSAGGGAVHALVGAVRAGLPRAGPGAEPRGARRRPRAGPPLHAGASSGVRVHFRAMLPGEA